MATIHQFHDVTIPAFVHPPFASGSDLLQQTDLRKLALINAQKALTPEDWWYLFDNPIYPTNMRPTSDTDRPLVCKKERHKTNIEPYLRAAKSCVFWSSHRDCNLGIHKLSSKKNDFAGDSSVICKKCLRIFAAEAQDN
jgi:hypothetical protein